MQNAYNVWKTGKENKQHPIENMKIYQVLVDNITSSIQCSVCRPVIFLKDLLGHQRQKMFWRAFSVCFRWGILWSGNIRCGWKMHINGTVMLWENVVRKHCTSHLSTAMRADGRINVIMKIIPKLHQQYAINLRGFVNTVIMSLWLISSIWRNLFPITMLIKTQFQVMC